MANLEKLKTEEPSITYNGYNASVEILLTTTGCSVGQINIYPTSCVVGGQTITGILVESSSGNFDQCTANQYFIPVNNFLSEYFQMSLFGTLSETSKTDIANIEYLLLWKLGEGFTISKVNISYMHKDQEFVTRAYIEKVVNENSFLNHISLSSENNSHKENGCGCF